MAACGGLEHIFEKPLPENTTLLESLSPWKHIKPIDGSTFTEIFGELHFKENNIHVLPDSSSSSSPSSSLTSSLDDKSRVGDNTTSLHSDSSSFRPGINSPRPGIDTTKKENNGSSSSYNSSIQKRQYKNSDSFPSMNSESLSLCTEGLGFESFGDVEDLLKIDICNNQWQHQEERKSFTRTENHCTESKRSGTSRGTFPPPISCIGRSGKPWVCFKSYRQDGRFILKEIRIPTQEFLHACRENGRLKLQFIQSDDEILEDDEEEDDANEDDIEDRGNDNADE